LFGDTIEDWRVKNKKQRDKDEEAKRTRDS